MEKVLYFGQKNSDKKFWKKNLENKFWKKNVEKKYFTTKILIKIYNINKFDTIFALLAPLDKNREFRFFHFGGYEVG